MGLSGPHPDAGLQHGGAEGPAACTGRGLVLRGHCSLQALLSQSRNLPVCCNVRVWLAAPANEARSWEPRRLPGHTAKVLPKSSSEHSPAQGRGLAGSTSPVQQGPRREHHPAQDRDLAVIGTTVSLRQNSVGTDEHAHISISLSRVSGPSTDAQKHVRHSSQAPQLRSPPPPELRVKPQRLTPLQPEGSRMFQKRPETNKALGYTVELQVLKRSILEWHGSLPVTTRKPSAQGASVAKSSALNIHIK